MAATTLRDFIQPFPDISFIFVPPAEGWSRTWIYRAAEDPQSILDYHFSSLMTHGWRVLETSPRLVAERHGSNIAVSASRLKDETRIVYEVTGEAEP